MGKHRFFKAILPLVCAGAMCLGAGCSGSKESAKKTESFNNIRGMDISSYISVQDGFDALNKEENTDTYGFKDFDGKTIRDQDFFDFLAKQGMNWVRIKVWNDPYDENGNGYGGGTSDLKKAIKLGKWATSAGMRVLIDFHYSDDWADPARQTAPKAWTEYNGDPDKTADAVKSFTTESLNTLLDEGVDVGMVQVGNETNNGIAGVSASGDWKANVAKVYAAGCDAVHDVAEKHNRKMLAVVHFTDPQNGGQLGYANFLDQAGVNYDVFATSWYPYWHGTAESITENLTQIAQKFGKKVMIAETSYANTLTDYDGFDNTVSEGNNDVGDGTVFPFTVDGQAKSFHSAVKAALDVKDSDGKTAGLGAFYWEGAWNGLMDISGLSGEKKTSAIVKERKIWDSCGCGWTSSYSHDYDPTQTNGTAGGCVIDNQSFFGPDGRALESLKAFSADYDGTQTIKEDLTVSDVKVGDSDKPLELDPSIEMTQDLLGTAEIHYTNGSRETTAVNWDSSDIEAYEKARQSGSDYGKTFTINGTTESGNEKVSREVILLNPNLIKNGDFETADFTDWTASDGSSGYDIETDSNNVYKGHNTLHFYSDNDFSFWLSQDVTVTDPGTYTASMVTSGEFTGSDDAAYVQICGSDGSELASSEGTLAGWQQWNKQETDKSIEVTQDMIDSGDNVFTVKIGVDASAKSWGAIDEVRFEKN